MTPIRTLSASALVLAVCLVQPCDGVAQDRSIFSMLDTQARTVAPSMSAEGELLASDVLSAGGRRVQVWALSAAPGAALQIDLRSSDFDAYLYVVGPGLGDGLRDDDGGEGLNSRLCVSMTLPGEYRVVASSLSGETGAFTLEVSDQPDADDGVCPESDAAEEITDLALLPTEGRTLAVGDDVNGTLLDTDPLVFDSPAQAWAVSGVAGQPFSVDLRSEDFDAYLMVEGPGLDSWLEDDDGAGACDSRVTLDFPETGTYRVVVSTLDVFGGAFRLIASEEPGATNPNGCIAPEYEDEEPLVADVDAVRDVGTLTYEQTVSGTMTGSETLFEGRSTQGWSLSGSAGDRLAIEVRSAEFDSYMYFSGPGFPSPLSDDDGAGNLHSRICVELPESGDYRVFAGPLSDDHAGERYSVEVTVAGADAVCESFSVSITTLPTEGRSISLGSEVGGVLPTSAPIHPDDNRPIQAWSYDGQAGQTVFIDLVSSEFDAVLYAFGNGIGSLFADDFGEGCNSRLEITPTESGRLTILAGSYSAGGTGSFILRASTDPPEIEGGGCSGGDTSSGGAISSDPSTVASISSGESRRIEVGTEVEGSLGEFEEMLPTGEPAQPWTVSVQAGDELVFELISDDFDPKLYLDGATLFTPLMDDDSAGSLDSRITYSVTQSGVMRLIVTAYEAENTGTFRLRVIRLVR